MQIKVRAKNLKLDSHLKIYIDQKIGSLDKFLPGIMLARVEVSCDRHHRKGNVFYAEVMLELKGNNLYVHENAQDLYSAIDICRDQILREIRKFKTKMRDKKRGEERKWKRLVRVWRWKRRK